MAISDRLNKLTTDITSAYTSIENKGGTIPANKNTDNLHTAIDSIEVIEQATAEGESLSLANTKAMPYKDCKVKGKSEQATRSGKNLYNIFDINNVSGLTVNNDGWATATINNSSGASLIILNLKVPTTNLINVSTNYALFLEIETVSGQGFLCLNESSVKSQFQTDRTLLLSTLTANSVNKYIMTTRNNFESSTNMFWSYLYAEAGKSCSIKYRLSVLADTSITTDDFVYEPYGASPSPEYPSEIHSVADDVNLFDIGVKSDYRGYNDQNVTTQGNYSWFTIENNKLKYLVQDYGTTLIYNKNQYKGNQSYNLQYVASSIYSRMLIKLRNGSDNGWLTDSDVTISGWTYIGSYNGWFIEFSEATNIEKIVNIPNCLYCVFGFGYGSRSGTTGTNQTISFIKIAKGTTSTPYSPYNQGTVTIKQRGKNLAYTGWAENFVNAVNNSNQTKIETYQNKNCLYFTPIAGSGSYPTKNLTLGISFKENTQYTISCDILKLNKPHNTLAIQYTDGTSTPFTTVSATNTWEHKTITSTLNKTIAFIRPNYTDGNTYINIDTWQIEERNNSNYIRTISS